MSERPPPPAPSLPPKPATLAATPEGDVPPKPAPPAVTPGAVAPAKPAAPTSASVPPAPPQPGPVAAPKPPAKPVAWPYPAMHAQPTDVEDIEALEKAVAGAVEKRGMDATGKPVVYVKADKLLDAARHAHDALSFDHLACLTVIDYVKEGTFDVTYNLYSYPRGRHLVLKVLLPRAKPEVASVTPVWRGANWHERESFDLFGVTFTGHPDLRRMFLPEGWKGHPLRKDYDMKEQFVGMDDETGEDVVYDEPGEYRW